MGEHKLNLLHWLAQASDLHWRPQNVLLFVVPAARIDVFIYDQRPLLLTWNYVHAVGPDGNACPAYQECRLREEDHR